jgi:predicted NBD/HSP70 family sugar kinase
MGGTKIYGAVNDLDGTALHELRVPTYAQNGTSELDQLITVIESLIRDAETHYLNLLGIGVGVPGMTANGRVLVSPALGWKDMPLEDILGERFGLRVMIENDVNLAALGEYGFGAGRGASSMICIAIGTGIGSGIVIDGKLYRGHRASAGEIGYMMPGLEFMNETYSEEFGALERLASGTGMTRRARQALRDAGNTALADTITGEQVVAAVVQGEAWAKRVVDETVDYLTLALTNVSAVLDPEVIVLSGGVMAFSDLFVEPITRRMQRLIPFVPRVVGSSLGPRAATLGATVLVAASQPPSS